MKNFNNKLSVPISRSGKKLPIIKWSNSNNLIKYQNIDTNKVDIGVLCGYKNNLLVLDIDIKNGKNGLDCFYNFNDNILDFFLNLTFCEQSKSGGYHIYFNYNHSDPFIRDQIKLYGSKLGLYEGLDIISEKKYIKCYPSSNYKLLNDRDIVDIPNDLFLYLFSNIKIKEIKEEEKEYNEEYEIIKRDYNSIYKDDEIINLLDLLPEEYLKVYNKWIIITNILKYEKLFDIWNNWCKKDINNYNYDNNIKIWNNIEPFINIDYLTYILKIRSFNKYKTYKPLTNIYNIAIENIEIKHLTDMENKLKNKLPKHKNIIIKSPTGSAKTTLIAQLLSKFKSKEKYNKLQFITITARETLAHQHIKSFEDIKLISYKQIKENNYDKDMIHNNNISICFNSLFKVIGDYTDEDMNNTIIYLDEITSLLKYISHCSSDVLKNIKLLFYTFLRLIKKCKILILSDAIINDLSIDLINKNRDIKDVFFINNTFKNQVGKEVFIIKNETEFINKLQDHINNNNYFLFGCDSKTIITDYYNTLKLNNEDKFLLYSADTKDKNEKLYDVKMQWNEKFVFYSATIQYGVDYSADKSSDVFLYIQGNTLESDDLNQMLNRCRNINNVYIFNCSNQKNIIKYNDLNECKKYFNHYNNLNDKLINMCLKVDDDYNNIIENNLFFDIYCYNEYTKSIYELDKCKYLCEILISNGMTIHNNDDKLKKLKKDMWSDMHNLTIDEELKEFNDFLTCRIEEEKHKKYINRMSILNITLNDVELINKYKDYIIHDKRFKQHLELIRLFKHDDVINNKLNLFNEKNYKIKTIDNIYNKISTLRKFINNLDINIFDFKYEKYNTKYDDELYKLVIKQFGLRIKKPTEINDIKKLHYKLLNEIDSNLIYKDDKTKKKGSVKYYLNYDYINHNIQLNKNYNKNYINMIYDINENEIINI